MSASLGYFNCNKAVRPARCCVLVVNHLFSSSDDRTRQGNEEDIHRLRTTFNDRNCSYQELNSPSKEECQNLLSSEVGIKNIFNAGQTPNSPETEGTTQEDHTIFILFVLGQSRENSLSWSNLQSENRTEELAPGEIISAMNSNRYLREKLKLVFFSCCRGKDVRSEMKNKITKFGSNNATFDADKMTGLENFIMCLPIEDIGSEIKTSIIQSLCHVLDTVCDDVELTTCLASHNMQVVSARHKEFILKGKSIENPASISSSMKKQRCAVRWASIFHDLDHSLQSIALKTSLENSGTKAMVSRTDVLLNKYPTSSDSSFKFLSNDDCLLVVVLARITLVKDVGYCLSSGKTFTPMTTVVSWFSTPKPAASKPKIFMFLDNSVDNELESCMFREPSAVHMSDNAIIVLARGRDMIEIITDVLWKRDGNLQQRLNDTIWNISRRVLAFTVSTLKGPLHLQPPEPLLSSSKVVFTKNPSSLETMSDLEVSEIVTAVDKSVNSEKGHIWVISAYHGTGESRLVDELKFTQNSSFVLEVGLKELIQPKELNFKKMIKKIAKAEGLDAQILYDKLVSKGTFIIFDGFDELDASRRSLALKLFEHLLNQGICTLVTTKSDAFDVYPSGCATILEEKLLSKDQQIKCIANIMSISEDRATEICSMDRSRVLESPLVSNIFRQRLRMPLDPLLSLMSRLIINSVAVAKSTLWVAIGDASVKEFLHKSELTEASYNFVESIGNGIEKLEELGGRAKTDNNVMVLENTAICELLCAVHILAEDTDILKFVSSLASPKWPTLRYFLDENVLAESSRAKLVRCIMINQAHLRNANVEIMQNVISEGLFNLFCFLLTPEMRIGLGFDDLMNPSSEFLQKWNKSYRKGPLYYACLKSEKIALKMLEIFEVPIPLLQKEELVFTAAKKGFTTLLKKMLEMSPAQMNRTDGSGLTALHYAVGFNHSKTVRHLLLSEGIEAPPSLIDKTTPLHLAAGNLNFEISKLLFISGVQQDSTDSKGRNSLHYAAKSKKVGIHASPVIEFLVSIGADINGRNEHEETPLSLAVEHGNLEIFQYLLSKHADFRIADKEGLTVLHRAAIFGASQALLYLDQNVPGSVRQLSGCVSNLGFMAVHLALRFGHLKIIKELLPQGSYSFQDKEFQLCLQEAVKKNHLEVVQYLVQRGCCPNTVTGSSALHLTEITTEAVTLLLSNRTDVNSLRDASGKTPLHCAVEHKRVEVVFLLLMNGADPLQPDTQGKSPRDLAISLEAAECLEAINWHLEQHGIANDLGTAGSSNQDHLPKEKETLSMEVDDDEAPPQELPFVNWEEKRQQFSKRYLVHEHLDNLKLNIAMHRYFTFPADYDVRAGVERIHLAHSGFFFTSDYMSLQCHYCTYEIKNLDGWKNLDADQINARHEAESLRSFGRFCPLRRGEEVGDVPVVSTFNYIFEAHRLYSFLQDRWTNPNISIYDLARHGFYCTGQDDNCRCAFCKLEVRGWEPGDSALGEHQRWNAKCALIQPHESTSNIPIGRELSSEGLVTDGAGGNSNPFVRTSITQYGIHIKYCSYVKTRTAIESLGVTPVGDMKYRQYSTLQSREQSFRNWPKQLSQRPDILSKAGFFYTGTGDRVLCFQCGGGLKDWDPKDSPWIEHAKWFGRCPYLAIKKGKEYINHVVHKNKEPATLIVTTDSGSSRSLSGTSSMTCRHCLQNEMNCVNLPCGHMSSCIKCIEKETKCKVCKVFKSAYVEVFL